MSNTWLHFYQPAMNVQVTLKAEVGNFGVNVNNFFVFYLEKNVIIPVDNC